MTSHVLYLIRCAAIGCICSCFLFGCKSDPFEREQRIFDYYTQELGHTVPGESHVYYLIGATSCPGCRTAFANYFIGRGIADSITIFIGEKILNDVGILVPQDCSDSVCRTGSGKEIVALPRKNDRVIIDSANLMDKLNWSYSNLTEIHTKEGKIVFIDAYSSLEIAERFK